MFSPCYFHVIISIGILESSSLSLSTPGRIKWTLVYLLMLYSTSELGYLIFGPAEALSNTLQCKDTSFQEAMAAVTLARSFYERKRNIIVSMTKLLENL